MERSIYLCRDVIYRLFLFIYYKIYREIRSSMIIPNMKGVANEAISSAFIQISIIIFTSQLENVLHAKFLCAKCRQISYKFAYKIL